ncbi:MAG: ABC transporter permease [Actinomycetota bacterium]
MIRKPFAALRGLDPESRWGLAVLVPIILLGSLVPAFSPYHPEVAGTGIPLQPPDLTHLFGTDDLGRDVFVRTFAAAQLDMTLAFLGVAGPLLIGTFIGAVIGTTKWPLVSGAWMILIDAINAFPFIAITLAIVALFGSGPQGILAALTLTNWARYAKLARARALVVGKSDYFFATRVLGYSRPRVLLRHVLPNVYSESLAYGLSDFVFVILVIAGLSFLGAGTRPPTPEWGAMMSDGRLFLTTAWWIAVFPGLALSVTAVGVALVADGLERRSRE